MKEHLGANSLGSEEAGQLGIVGSSQLAERRDHVFCTDFHGKARPVAQLFCHPIKFRQHRLVDFQEFLGVHPCHVEELDGGDLKPILDNSVDDLAKEVLVERMGFDDTKRAI